MPTGLELMPSGEVSVPVLLFKVHKALQKDQVADEELLQSIADRALTRGCLFVVMRSTYLDTVTRPPLLKCVTPGLPLPGDNVCLRPCLQPGLYFSHPDVPGLSPSKYSNAAVSKLCQDLLLPELDDGLDGVHQVPLQTLPAWPI